jgi:hypothetical protein
VTLGANPNYSVVSTNGILSVTQSIAVTVIADGKSSIRDENPALTVVRYAVNGGDTINYTLATTATQFSNVGDYPIAVTLEIT